MKILNQPIFLLCPRSARIWFTAVLGAAVLAGISAQAQVEWVAASPDDYSDPAAWAGNTVPTTGNAAITNSGTCNFTASDSYTIGQLWMGGIAANTGGGSNTFNMTGGTLMFNDTGGNDFSIGGNSYETASTLATTNTFTMSLGTLSVGATTGNSLIGMPSNCVAVVNFNGGVVTFNGGSTGGGLFVGGLGSGTLNINGAKVTVNSTNNLSSQGALTIGLGLASGGHTGVGSGTLNMMSGTLNVTNAPLHVGGKGSNSVLNLSGGTINCAGVLFGNGGNTTATSTNTLNMSGGNLNIGVSGISQNGASNVRIKLFSGGTISTLPGANWAWSTTLTPSILTNTPGPGYLTLAPLAGTTITCPGASPVEFTGPGALVIAGPGTVKLNGPHNFTGGLTNAGGTLEINVAQTQVLGLTNTGGNLQIDNINNALQDNPIVMPGGTTLIFSNTGAIAFTNAVNGPGSLLVKGGGAVTNAGNLNYTGNTTVNAGNLVLTGTASITSASTVVNSGGTLSGSGVISGGTTLFTSGSTLAVGFPGGTYALTNNGALTFDSGSTNSVVVNKTVPGPATNASDIVTGLASVTIGGTLVVTNIGTDPLVAGDAIPLFSAASYSGSFDGGIVPATPGAGLAWSTNTLLTDGTLRVLATVNTAPTNMVFSLSGNQFSLSWPADHTGWRLQSQTNPPGVGITTNWSDVSGATNVDQTNITINPANGSVFYRMIYP